MILSEFLNQIKTLPEYVHNSIILKSYDDFGCTYKYLLKTTSSTAIRIEIFIELDEEESALELLNKTVINSIEVTPAK